MTREELKEKVYRRTMDKIGRQVRSPTIRAGLNQKGPGAYDLVHPRVSGPVVTQVNRLAGNQIWGQLL